MLSIIVAMDPNHLIGKGNELPWYYPEDLKYFKKVTSGKAVLMGYNTYLSIVDRLGHTLPNRINYVLTYEKSLPGDAIIVKDLEELIKEYQERELFIIGGKTIYEMLIDRADFLYITRIHKEFDGDVYFPSFDETNFHLVKQEFSKNCTFEIYERLK